MKSVLPELPTTQELIDEAVQNERRRCLDLHKQCREGACPSLFRIAVKQGVSTNDMQVKIDDMFAQRR